MLRTALPASCLSNTARKNNLTCKTLPQYQYSVSIIVVITHAMEIRPLTLDLILLMVTQCVTRHSLLTVLVFILWWICNMCNECCSTYINYFRNLCSLPNTCIKCNSKINLTSLLGFEGCSWYACVSKILFP